jgi:hypothetical protein
MMTWSEQGFAVLQFAFCGIVTWKVFEPLCRVFTVDPAGSPSARTGCVGDQTGFIMIAGVQFVPAIGTGSGRVVNVWVELAPSCNAMRHQPGCAIVDVTETESV